MQGRRFELLDGVFRREIEGRVFPFGYPRREQKLAEIERWDERCQW